MKLDDILQIVDGSCDAVDVDIASINDTKRARKGEITFFSDRKFLDDLKNTKASFVLIRENDKDFLPSNVKAVVVDDPYLAFAKLSQLFAPKSSVLSQNVVIGEKCDIDKSVVFHSNIVIGNNVTIGKNSIIYPNVTIYDNTVIGENCIIHAGTVIGSDGFGYAYTKNRKAVKIYHFGKVILEDNVEIGSNCAIDRGVFGDTLLQDGVKVDNLVHIGHNCEFGKDSIVTGQCGFAGSSKIGSKVTFGAQSGVAGHLKISDNIMFAARSGVTKSITKGGVYAGFPAKPHKQWLKEIATISKISKKKG